MQNWQSHTFPSRYHGGEDVLSKLLPKLSHLDLTGRVKGKEAMVGMHGGYCDVFVGRIASEHLLRHRTIPTGFGEIKVVIKRLRVNLRKDKPFAKSLAREMGVWATLDHPNILPLLGYVLDNGFPSFVSEWIENGTAGNFVKNNPECNVTHLAFGIAKGLEYMHDHDVVHSDLKGDNVLIKQSGEPLICDFGISRMLNSSQTFFVSTTQDGSIKGSTRWMAIELLMPDAGADPKHTKETDVWAYGMTLYEMISKQVPYAHYRNDAQVLLAIMKGELPTNPTSINAQSYPMELWVTCTSSWEKDSRDRLTMAQITARLKCLEVQHQGIAPPSETKQANLESSSVGEQDDHRRTNGMSLSPFARDRFLVTLQDWWRRTGTKPDARMTTIGNRQIDMYQLHTEVLHNGGVFNVRRRDLWNDIAARMGWTPSRIRDAGRTQEQIAEHFKLVYEQLLESFEVEYMPAAMKESPTAQSLQTLDRQGAPSAGDNRLTMQHSFLTAPVR